MATISEKNTRRFRVQFTMSRSLHQAYEASQERANRLNVAIDFSRDFEKWFTNQLEQVSRELQQLETEHLPVLPVSRPTTDRSQMEGGADHGDTCE